MVLKCNEMKGQDALDYGKVRIATNKPEWCCLIFITPNDGLGEIALLWDEKHQYLDVSWSIPPIEVDDSSDEPSQEYMDFDPHIDVDDEKRSQILAWIASYCE